MNVEELARLIRSMSDDVRALNENLLAETRARPTSRPVTGTSAGPVPSPLALLFTGYWRAARGPELQEEYRFHPARKWRADYAHLPTKVLIELEGGIYFRSRHTSTAGFQEDARKYNAAVAGGWALFRLPSGFTREDVQQIIQYIQEKQGEPTP